MEKPNYIATKSAWSVISIWHILLFWLIIPLIVMIVKIVQAKHEKIEIYEDNVVVKSGVIAQKERRSALTAILNVSVEKTIMGRICGYGNVNVDVVGRWDVNLNGVKEPDALKNYFASKISAKKLSSIVTDNGTNY